MLAWNRLVAAVLAQFYKITAFDAFHFDILSIFKQCNPCFNWKLLVLFAPLSILPEGRRRTVTGCESQFATMAPQALILPRAAG